MGVQGITTSVAVSEGGVVAEAHAEVFDNAPDGNIVTTIGIVSNDQIYWGSGQVLGNTFYNPAICITRDGKTAVLIYEGNKEGTNTNTLVTLRYRVGSVDAVNKTISWGSDVPYDEGIYPSISINNHGHIITTHNSWQSNSDFWYKVGQLNADNTVDWGPTAYFNSGDIGTSVSIRDDAGDGSPLGLFLVYSNNGTLWLSVGIIDPPGSMTAQWPDSTTYGKASSYVAPACSWAYDNTVVEVHDSGSIFIYDLWYGILQ